MYQIGQFSKMTRTTIKTLRYYDSIGLLKPQYVDEFTGYRFYGTNQLMVLHKIQSFRQIGLSIDEIKTVLDGGMIEKILEDRKKKIESEISYALEQLSRIEFILSKSQEENFMNYQAIIKELPECTVYSKKMTVKDYDSYFQVIPEIGKKVTSKYPDLKCAIPEYCFISYLDGEYKDKDMNIEFCEAIESIKEDFDDIKFKKIQSVTAVSVMHKGPYSTISGAYTYAFNWLEENGYKAAGAPRENFIDGIWNKEDPNDWLTELQIPIVKR